MINPKSNILLVGDNPLQGVDHLSQERSRLRRKELGSIGHLADLVETSLANDADGFMFSVSEVTLSILCELRKRDFSKPFSIYAIVPYAYEYVRMVTQRGGLSGMAKKIARDALLSGNGKAVLLGISGIARTDLAALLDAYILFEISRIKSAKAKNVQLASVLLHEMVTEMTLALDMESVIKTYIDFVRKLKVSPGFETRNFAYLVEKFNRWNISCEGLTIATPFNKLGFQMNPSREACENALKNAYGARIIGMSVLASGYLKPAEAIEYMKTLPNIGGIVIGVSKEQQARETFRFFREQLG